jgi:ATPase subunit of ABC transporter with duplicated ATPase domains
MLVQATDLRHAYGDRVTLAGVSFALFAGMRVALTGRNGAGKTTLLRILTGELRPESGELEVAPDVRIGYLVQDPLYGAETVADVMSGALGFVTSLETQLRDLERRMDTDPTALEQWSVTLERFELAGGYGAQAQAAQTIAALELTPFLGREAGSLSGGERTRLALAVALIGRPDVLILDEPTNHLDIRMREWLERELQEYAGAVLIVSHDRRLLDGVAQQTFHLERGELNVYAGGYTKSRLARLEMRRVQQKNHRIGSFEARRLEAANQQVAAWGVENAKLARRAKAIQARAERVRESLVEAPARERRIVMALQSSDARAETILRAEHLSKSYGDSRILIDAGLRIRLGDRVALLAPNGAGKTTLLKMLLGELAPDTSSGTGLESSAPLIRYADGAVAVHFDQTFHGLSPNRAILEQLASRVGEGAGKALMGRYGFKPEDWHKRPSSLSGGERARAGLALIAATRADLLLLDEPTNHLDVETLETLEEALTGYPGSLLFVTHDREFARHVATKVFGIEGGKLLEYPDGFAGYERSKRGERVTLDPARLLEHELERVVTEKPLTLAQNIQLLEERLTELEELFLHRVNLTERDWGRLRAERSLARARLETLYALHFAAPLEFDHRVRFFKQTILAASDESGTQWRIWMRGSIGCPSLSGQLETSHLTLGWLEGNASSALPWFTRSLLEGARMIAFEHIAAERVTLPDGVTLSSLEYARTLGLLRPALAMETRKRRRRKARGAAQVQTVMTAPQASSPAPEAAKKKKRRRRKPKVAAPIAL